MSARWTSGTPRRIRLIQATMWCLILLALIASESIALSALQGGTVASFGIVFTEQSIVYSLGALILFPAFDFLLAGYAELIAKAATSYPLLRLQNAHWKRRARRVVRESNHQVETMRRQLDQLKDNLIPRLEGYLRDQPEKTQWNNKMPSGNEARAALTQARQSLAQGEKQYSVAMARQQRSRLALQQREEASAALWSSFPKEMRGKLVEIFITSAAGPQAIGKSIVEDTSSGEHHLTDSSAKGSSQAKRLRPDRSDRRRFGGRWSSHSGTGSKGGPLSNHRSRRWRTSSKRPTPGDVDAHHG